MSAVAPRLAAPDLSQRMAMILDGLCRVAAARAAKDRGAVTLVVLLWPYLRRLAARFERLLARRPVHRLAARPPRPTSAALRRPPLPRGFGWLLRLVPESAAYAGQLQHLLASPEMAELLAMAPQAGRMLRPLCRMLGRGPDELPPALVSGDRPARRPPHSAEPAATAPSALLPPAGVPVPT